MLPFPECFNEAAGVPRGIPVAARAADRPAPGFNEAAGVPRGILPGVGRWNRLDACFNEAAGVPRGIRPSSAGIRHVVRQLQ